MQTATSLVSPTVRKPRRGNRTERQGQKAQWWARKANRGVGQVGKSLERGRSPQQKRRGIRRPLGPIFNTTGRDTPEMQGSKAGAAFNQAEWTQGARTAGK